MIDEASFALSSVYFLGCNDNYFELHFKFAAAFSHECYGVV